MTVMNSENPILDKAFSVTVGDFSTVTNRHDRHDRPLGRPNRA
jgi:hypothetical protein